MLSQRPVARRETQRGLTLVELLVTLAVMAILLPIGFSGLGAAATSMRLTSASNLLLSHIAPGAQRGHQAQQPGRAVQVGRWGGLRRNAAAGSRAGSFSTTPTTMGCASSREAASSVSSPLPGNLRLTGNHERARDYLSFAPTGRRSWWAAASRPARSRCAASRPSSGEAPPDHPQRGRPPAHAEDVTSTSCA